MLTRSHIAVPGQKKKRSTDHLEMSSGREYAKFPDIVHTIIPTKRVLKKRSQTKIAFSRQESRPLFSTANSCFLQDIEALSVEKQIE